MRQYEYEVQGWYGGDWEMVTTENTRLGAEEQMATYRREEPATLFRIKKVLEEQDPDDTPDWLPVARRILANHQFEEVQGVVLDATTASMLVQLHDALNTENAAKFAAMNLQSAVSFGWRLVKKAEERKS